MSKVECPNPDCQSDKLRYVQKSFEYHSFRSMPDGDGNVELCALEESYMDEEYTPFIVCMMCGKEFNLDLTEKEHGE